MHPHKQRRNLSARIRTSEMHRSRDITLDPRAASHLRDHLDIDYGDPLSVPEIRNHLGPGLRHSGDLSLVNIKFASSLSRA
jgi:hypothetical protein